MSCCGSKSQKQHEARRQAELQQKLIVKEEEVDMKHQDVEQGVNSSPASSRGRHVNFTIDTESPASQSKESPASTKGKQSATTKFAKRVHTPRFLKRLVTHHTMFPGHKKSKSDEKKAAGTDSSPGKGSGSMIREWSDTMHAKVRTSLSASIEGNTPLLMDLSTQLTGEWTPTGRPIVYEPPEEDDDILPDPFTKELVINFRTKCLPREVLQNLRFTDAPVEGGQTKTKPGRLLQEFDYLCRKKRDTEDQPSSMNIKIEASTSEFDTAFTEERSYARIITINWWIMKLMVTFLQALIVLADLMSNVVFMANLAKPQKRPVPFEFIILFYVFFFALDGYFIYICAQLAKKDRAALKRSGDWVNSSWVDEQAASIAMVIFYFLMVPNTVKEIVKVLHPMKAAQQFAALKCDGHRCFVVGWPSRQAFRTSDNRGRDRLLPPFIFCKLVLTFYRFATAVYSRDVVAALTCLTGFGAISWQLILLTEIIVNRTKHYAWLKKHIVAEDLPIDVPYSKQLIADLVEDVKRREQNRHHIDADQRAADCKTLLHTCITHFEADKTPLGKWKWYVQMLSTDIIKMMVFVISLAVITSVYHVWAVYVFCPTHRQLGACWDEHVL